MFTKVKTDKEIAAMRESGRMLATVLEELRRFVKPGHTTKDLDEFAARELKALGGKPAFLGYQGYPAVLCVSINDEVVHGIPRTDHVIQDGDIVSMDFGVTHNGMITDAATSVIAGDTRKPSIEKLLEVTEQSLTAGIMQVGDGVRTGDIAHAIQEVLDKQHYGIVRDLVGHGVGHQVHEEPNIPNYGRKGHGDHLYAGMTIAIEPMATLGGHQVSVDADGWTIRTRDGSLAAHFEHTVLITEAGAEVLTEL